MNINYKYLIKYQIMTSIVADVISNNDVGIRESEVLLT